MTQKYRFLNFLQGAAFCAAIALVFISATFDTIYAQATSQPQAQTNSTLAPSAAPSAQQQSAPAATNKEIKETKEVKEIRDYPSDWVSTINSWPLAALLMLIIFLGSVICSSVLRELLTRSSRAVRKFKIGGVVEFEWDITALTKGIEKSIEEVDAQISKVNQAYEGAAVAEELSGHLSDVMLKALRKVLREHKLDDNLDGVRGTIHVPDLVFNEFFFQLVNYFPDAEVGARRRFSQRFGIIGRAWRLDKSQGRGSGTNTVDELVILYGMFPEEATAQSRNNPADLCVILRNKHDGHRKLGLLFIDSKHHNKFGFNDKKHGVTAMQIVEALEKEKETQVLAEALSRAVVPLRTPKIDLTRTMP